MANDDVDQTQRTLNLARIRDNQRRSRARRREYLQELEENYRACRERGVQASSEIQAAARLVIEENKRLRVLLLQMGLSETELDDGAHSDSCEDGPASPAASALHTMLTTRRECPPQGCDRDAGLPNRSGHAGSLDAEGQSRSGQVPTSLPQGVNNSQAPIISTGIAAPSNVDIPYHGQNPNVLVAPQMADRRNGSPQSTGQTTVPMPSHSLNADEFDALYHQFESNPFQWPTQYGDLPPLPSEDQPYVDGNIFPKQDND